MSYTMTITTGATPTTPMAPCLDCGWHTECDIQLCDWVGPNGEHDDTSYGYCERCGGMAVEGCPVPPIVTGMTSRTVYA